jgi:WD40 repeat protein
MPRVVERERNQEDVTITGATWRWRLALPDYAPRVEFSPDRNYVAVACLDGSASVLDAADGALVYRLQEHPFGVLDIAWSPDGSLLATCGQDGAVRIVSIADGGVERGSFRASGWASRVRWSNDGTRLACAIGRNVALLSNDGAVLGEFGRADHTVSDVVWTPDDRRLGVLSYGGVRWFGTGQPKDRPDRVFAWKGSPLRAAMSPTGAYLAHGNQDNSVHVWRMSSTDEMEMGGFPAKVEVLSWYDDGEWLAVGTVGMTTVWDCSGKGPAGRRAIMCVGHDRRVSALAWTQSPLAPVLVTASADGTLQWYRPTGARQGAELEPLGGVMVGGEVVDLGLETVSVDGVLGGLIARNDGTVGIVNLELPLHQSTKSARPRVAARGKRS